jgi:hypothetical protein
MVEDGVNGWKVDVQELDEIARRIDEALCDREVYVRLAAGAVAQAGRYSQQAMVNSLQSAVDGY